MPRSRRWSDLTRLRDGTGMVARRLRDETGSAAIEFVTAGLILLVPIVYLVVALAAIQAGAFAAEAAARQAARL